MPENTPESTNLVTMGTRVLELGGSVLGTLRDSSHLRRDRKALLERMDEDGYLLLRGLHERRQVLDARRELLERLAEDGNVCNDFPLMDGVIAPDRNDAVWDTEQLKKSSPGFHALVTAPPIMEFFADFLGGPSATFDHKWLRVVGHGAFTGAHLDVVYMGRGTHQLYSCWTPIGDIDVAMGPLAINVGSHRLPGFARVRETYGRMDVDRDHVHGWFSNDPQEVVDKFGGRWATADFRAGDALIFGIWTLHASLTNTTRRFRISSDTRYQLAGAATDERWIGEKPIAHYGWDDPAKNLSMENAREKWGI
jgi:hypothetical protein